MVHAHCFIETVMTAMGMSVMFVETVFAMELHLERCVNVIVWRTFAPEVETRILDLNKSAQVWLLSHASMQK